MIETLQRFHWHEQHMLNLSRVLSQIAHLSHVPSEIFNIIQTYKLIHIIDTIIYKF